MTILQIKNTGMDFCLIFLIILNLNLGTSDINVFQKDFTDNNDNCKVTRRFNGSGKYTPEIKENCETFNVVFELKTKTSIMNLTASIQYTKQDESLIKKATDMKQLLNIRLCELPVNSNTCKVNDVLKKTCHEKGKTTTCVMTYISFSSKVFTKISGAENGFQYKLQFFYNEIPYRLIRLKPDNGGKMAQCEYIPNSVSLLQVPEPKTPLRGIEIRFDKLTVNTEMGEYILIGAGTKPFGNKYSRPLYITQVTENSTFFVDDSSAFVAFVSGTHRISSSNKAFSIQWKEIESDIDNEAEIPMADPNYSSLICFSNYSAALEEFKKIRDERFETFRQLFANISKTYLQGEYKAIQDKIDNKSIELLGAPMKMKNSDDLAILIRVIYGKKSIFTWSTLQKIIDESKENGTRILGYEVGKCSHEDYALPYKASEWKIFYYVLAPLLFVGLMMWAWKQNLFSQKCLTIKEEKLSFGHEHAEPNTYTTTASKMRYEEGRRETLIQGTSMEEDAEGTKNTIMVDMSAIPSSSQEQDTLARYLSSTRSKSRPSIQSLLDNIEEIKKQSHSSKTEGNESDHFYDSVSSSKQLHETKL